MAFTFCTSGSAVIKAGAQANADIIVSGSILAAWSDEVEGRIVNETGKDFLTNYATLPVSIQQHLAQVASAGIAKEIISYDMSGYIKITQAQTMLSYHDDVMRDGLRVLKDFKRLTPRDAI